MSEFDDIAEAFAVPQLMHFFGDTEIIDYSNALDARDATTTTTAGITAIVDEERTSMELTDVGERKIRAREIHVHTDSSGKWKGIPDPELHGTITLNDETWRIREIISRDATWVHFEVVRLRQQEHVKPGYRREA
jgi:hypothetical protein